MSKEENRRGHGRRLATDANGVCSVEQDPDASTRQRFYAAYQYFRLEPHEPSAHDFDDAARSCADQRHAPDPLMRDRTHERWSRRQLYREITVEDMRRHVETLRANAVTLPHMIDTGSVRVEIVENLE